MRTFYHVSDLIIFLENLRSEGKSIGFVPTMGALHAGHISLIQRSKGENDITVASIFVNPTQFNDKTDLELYPRTLEEDIAMLTHAGCDALLAPSVEEIYPNGLKSTPVTIELGTLGLVMEAAKRPGHFEGVVQVVQLLFSIVKPHRAYFGQKDFQQLAIISAMTKQLQLPIEIISCPIQREPDGLAMSSRNRKLTADERKEAVLIPQVLFDAKMRAKVEPFAKIEADIIDKFAKHPDFQLEYVEFVDALTLLRVNQLGEADAVVLCIATRLGKIRLIDNIFID